MNELQQYLLDMVMEEGHLPLDKYLAIVIPYYYANNHVFGKKGDFTTAPEISQLFGEVIAVWCAQKMLVNQDNTHFNLLELGPGRGTLMQDVLRTIGKIPAARAKLKAVHMVENSAALQQLQKQTLADTFVPITWHNTLAEVPLEDVPIICLANEFFDAMPIKQYVRTKDGLNEIVVVANQGKLSLAQKSVDINLYPSALSVGDIWEISEGAINCAQQLASLLGKNTASAAVLVDYGYQELPKTPTLQAVYKHKYCNILANIGQADISALVNFNELVACFQKAGLNCKLSTQAKFLKAHAIDAMAAILVNAGADIGAVSKQIERLCHPAKMGTLFKVLEIG